MKSVIWSKSKSKWYWQWLMVQEKYMGLWEREDTTIRVNGGKWGQRYNGEETMYLEECFGAKGGEIVKEKKKCVEIYKEEKRRVNRCI